MGKSITEFSSVTRVGLDLAKHVFQVHGVDVAGRVVFDKSVRRDKLLAFFSGLPMCRSVWRRAGRRIIGRARDQTGPRRAADAAGLREALRAPQKNDAADAAAICEAVSRPSMRFVPVRSVDNQADLMRHKAREMLVAQRTQFLNGLRGHLGEVGLIAAQGPRHARQLAEVEARDQTIPIRCARRCRAGSSIASARRGDRSARQDVSRGRSTDATARRLMTIPGIGPITASAIAASVPDVSGFEGPREFAAFLGLMPRQHSSGGKERLGRISKMGNRYLRKLLVVGAHAVLFHRKPHGDPLRMWAKRLIEKKPFKLVAVALANKLARIVFALLKSQTNYRGLSA